jgi:hypothetical protein
MAEDGKMSGRGRICAVFLAFVCCMASTNGSVVYTRLISTSFLATWYDWVSGTEGHLNFNNTSINVAKTLYTYNDVYTLSIVGKLTFNPNLARDYSSDGYAKGYFEGGATVTITGGLKLNGSYVYGGSGTAAKQIFQAVMLPVYEDSQNPTLNRWSLEEDVYQAGNFNRGLFLEMVDGSEGLASGITIGSDILKMTGPKMDLFLKCDNVSDFYTDMSSGSIASPINITGLIPEPATVLLFGLGALCLKRKR